MNEYGLVEHVLSREPKKDLCVRTRDGRFVIPLAVAFTLVKQVIPIRDEVQYRMRIELREHQAKDIQPILASLDKTGTSYFLAQCGYGKTVMFFKLIEMLKQKTLIVLPTLKLVQQTFESLVRVIDNPQRVQVLDTDHIILPTTDVLICFAGRIDTKKDQTEPIEHLKSFKFVILDEVHLLTAPGHITGLMNLRPARVAAFTATRGERNAITELFVGTNAIEASLVKNWRICFPRIETKVDRVRVDELVRESLKGMRGGESENRAVLEYTHSMSVLSASESIRDFVLDLVNYYAFRGKRMIVITIRNEMTDMLYEALNEDSDEGGRYVVEYLDRKKKDCGNCDVLLGTHKMMGTGFDEKNSIIGFEGEAASVLLFLGSIKNETLMYQLAGRVFRCDDPLVIFPTMTDISYSRRHVDQIKEIVTEKMPDCSICEETAALIEQITKYGLEVEEEEEPAGLPIEPEEELEVG
jgi:superfamily II DNA or RNA helicase